MECHCLPAHELPHTTPLYSAFLTDFAKVQQFFGHAPSLDGVRAAAAELKRVGHEPVALQARESIVEVLREQNRGLGGGDDVARNVERLAAGALAVVTGQQVGLFGGPAYSFYKALTAARLAQELTDAGVDAVPVFWLASEDHDLAEVNHCYWPGEGGALERLELELGEHAAGRSVGSVQFGAAVTPLVKRAAELLQGESYEWVESALRASYAPSETLSSAFGKMMTRLLAGRGLIMLDPLDARVHRPAAPVYARALEERETLASELTARGKELDKAGFHAQVKVTARSTLLFCEVDGRRVAIRQKGEALSAGDAPLRVEDARAMLEASPERFSANALLRPVVQDSVLPTAAYIGGPAEIAYLAQSQVIYKRLLGRMPAVLPRAAFTLVDAHTAKLLERYGLSVREVIAGRQGMRRKMEQASVPHGLAKQFDSAEKTLRGLLEKLRGPLRKLDGTLEDALDNAERKMLYQFLKLRGRAGRAESFRTGVLDRHERALLDMLHPRHGGLQERVHGLPPWLARYGPPLLDELERRARSGAHHQVLFL